jgi:hypothetical protein
MSGTLGAKRGRGRGSFIDSVLTAVDGFYGVVLGSLRAWSATPPKLRPVHPEPPEVDDTVPAALASTDYSSQDGTAPAGESDPGAAPANGGGSAPRAETPHEPVLAGSETHDVDDVWEHTSA